MHGIQIRWSRRRNENMEAFLSFAEVRTLFGLGGTPDNLLRKRVGQIASIAEIIKIAEKAVDPKTVSCDPYQTMHLTLHESVMEDEEPHPVCRTCHQPLPDDIPPF